MPGPILHVGAVMTCPHGGQVQVVPGSPRVLLTGMPAASMADQYLIVGCAFTVPPGKPQPCVRIQWTTPAVRVMINAMPAITMTSVGICMSADGIPAGPPIIANAQPRVIAT